MKEIETGDATPEQLLQMLDTRLALQRAQRASAGRNRLMFLAGGMLFIVIAAGVALVVLSQMLSEMRQDERQPTAQAGGQRAVRNF